MKTAPLPTVFVSHGAPDLVLHDTPAREFLKGLGWQLQKPRAILMVSAHFESESPQISISENPSMIYDFGGFDPKLKSLNYPAPGDAKLASRVGALLEQADIHPSYVERGYDHGTWVPLMLLYPQADIPVVQLSVQPDKSPRHHFEIGRALNVLRDEGVLIIGSGSLTHNLGAIFRDGTMAERDAELPDWVESFAHWMEKNIAKGNTDDLLNYRNLAPFADQNHPTDEHLLPLYVALGAAGDAASGERVHTSHEFGALMMDAYAFKQAA